MRLDIRTLGDPILRSKASPVTHFDDELRALSLDMHETMEGIGVGLAAPQVGRPIRMFVYNSGGESAERGTIVNPAITWFSEETDEMDEGCLSIPGTYFPVVRAIQITIKGQTLEGKTFERGADGYLARIFQHETDHLDGILFIDRLAPELRKEAMKLLRDHDFGIRAPAKPRPGEAPAL